MVIFVSVSVLLSESYSAVPSPQVILLSVAERMLVPFTFKTVRLAAKTVVGNKPIMSIQQINAASTLLFIFAFIFSPFRFNYSLTS